MNRLGSAVARVRDNDEGATLVELLVYMLLASFVSAAVLSGFVAASRVTQRTTDRVMALADLQRGVERVSREMRSGLPVTLNPFDVFRDGQRQRFSWTVTVAGELVQTRSIWSNPASDPAVTAPTSTGTLTIVRGLTNNPGTPAFTYFDRNRVACPCATVDRVEIRLVRTIPQQPAISVVNEADFRNVNLNGT